MQTKQCKDCGLMFLDVSWLKNRINNFCSKKCENRFLKEQERIKQWRKRLNSMFEY